MPEDIDHLLGGMGLMHGSIRIDPLTGGYWNKVFRVTTGNLQFIVKQFTASPSSGLFPNLPYDEARALAKLEGLDVAPRLIGFWPDCHLLVYQYVEGSHWNGDFKGMAAALIRKERADARGFRRVATDPSQILAEGDLMFEKCSEGPATPRPVTVFPYPPSRLSLIHTDLGAANVIGAGDDLRIIDWQCPAEGDICEDIFSFLSPAFHILSGRRPLAPDGPQAFFGALARPDLEERFDVLQPFFAWRMAGYCAWRAETAADEAARTRYGEAARVELATLAGP